MSQREEILASALERFSLQGIAATSLQDIADHASSSKGNVLYHFTSKEHLVDVVLLDALQAIEAIVLEAEVTGLVGADSREGFVARFIDFLLEHRQGVQIIVSHPYLADSIPALRQAQELMGRLARLFAADATEQSESLRFGIAVSGATYALVAGNAVGIEELPDAQLRPLLTDFLLNTLHLGALAPRVR